MISTQESGFRCIPGLSTCNHAYRGYNKADLGALAPAVTEAYTLQLQGQAHQSWGTGGVPVSGRRNCLLHVSPVKADRPEAAYTPLGSGVKPPAARITYGFKTLPMPLVALLFCSTSACMLRVLQCRHMRTCMSLVAATSLEYPPATVSLP